MSALRAVASLLAVGLAGTGTAGDITVTTLDDGLVADGSCSLREALVAAEANAAVDACAAGESGAVDRIGFAPALFDGGDTATITLAGTLEVAGGSVSVALERDVQLTIASPGTFPILEVALDGGADFDIDGGPGWIELSGGAGGRGGGALGFASGAALSLARVRLAGNAGGFGGAVTVDTGDAVEVSLQSVEASGNASTGDGGAIAVRAGGTGATVVVGDSRFASNQGSGRGGAIALLAAETGSPLLALEVDGSRFDTQIAEGHGGALAVSDEGNGDASLRVHIDGSRFRANGSYSDGGAVWVARQAGGNGAERGLRMRRNSLLSNEAGFHGGALASVHVDLELENNLWAGNIGHGDAGAIHHRADAIAGDGLLAIVANTLSGNEASGFAGAAMSFRIEVPDNVMVPARYEANLVDATAPGPGDSSCVFAGPGSLGTARWNAASDAALGDCAPGTGAVLAAQPGLDRLDREADAIHPLWLLPAPGSPLVDAWPEEDCLSLSGTLLGTDLVGQRRLPPEGVPVDGDGVDPADCDIGAFEAPDPDALRVFADGFEPPA